MLDYNLTILIFYQAKNIFENWGNLIMQLEG